jgi:PAS domain S-box-containing protein
MVYKKTAATHAKDSLVQLAFDNGAQASVIIAVASGKIIMANSACSKLLGYSKKILLTKNRTDIFDIKESHFKAMLKQREAKGQSRALVFAIKKNGKPLPCEITSAIFTGEDGLKKSITTIVDISTRLLNQKKIDTEKASVVAGNIIIVKAKQKRVDTQKEKKVVKEALQKQNENDIWRKYVGKTSFDVMWDWNLDTDKIYVGDSIVEVFGCKIKDNLLSFKNFKRSLLPEEKSMVEKKILAALTSRKLKWKGAFKIRRKDGTVAFTECRAQILRNDVGKALHWIGAIKDISKQLEEEEKIKTLLKIKDEDSEKFSIATQLSFDSIWDWNLLTGEVFRGEGFSALLGDNKKGDATQVSDFKSRIHSDDYDSVENSLNNAIISTDTHWENTFRFTRVDGTVAKVFDRACIMRDAKGKAYRMVGVLKDLSLQKDLEEKLDHEIKLKEKQISDATEDAKEMERSAIGKELHDNINQLLGASRMYLEMAKRGSSNTPMYLKRSSEYTLTAIEEIRKLSKGLTTDIIKNLGLSAAIENITDDLMEVSQLKITCAITAFNEKGADDKFKLNIFRIVQEQLNNILKHAQATTINICLLPNSKNLKLVIADNGIGFDTAKKQSGIGIDNIKERAAHYSGTANFISSPGKGCTLIVSFPISKIQMARP